MTSGIRAIVFGSTLFLLSAYVGAMSASAQSDDAAEPAPPTLSAPEEADPVAVAEKAVDDARAALREEMATGGDVRGARRALQEAIRHLNQVKEMAESGEESAEDGAEEAAEAPPEPAPAETAEEAPPAEAPTLAPPGNPPESAETTASEPPAEASQEASDGPPALPAPSDAEPAADAAADEAPAPEEADPEAAASEPPDDAEPPAEAAEAEETEEEPGFFGRIFGGDSEPEQAEDETARSEEAAEDSDEPVLPIFEELPPLDGPKVVAVAPGEAEVVAEEAEEDEKRIIVREGGRITVKHDDNDRFRRKGEEIEVEEGQNGTTITTVTRHNGTQVVTVRDAGGEILERYRKTVNGEVEMLIGDRDGDGEPRDRPAPGASVTERGQPSDFAETLPKLVVPIPQNQYVVGTRQASRSQIEQALKAPPVEAVERPYSLQEIRRSDRLRAKLRRIDVDTVNFEFGAATVAEDQIPNLQAIGNALAAIIADDPKEVFYIEGHTDAVGGNLANLALSDRRAESIAEILTFYFDIPPENLITQGYGEQYLKVLTARPERLNRRASVRRITPLLVGRPVAAAQ